MHRITRKKSLQQLLPSRLSCLQIETAVEASGLVENCTCILHQQNLVAHCVTCWQYAISSACLTSRLGLLGLLGKDRKAGFHRHPCIQWGLLIEMVWRDLIRTLPIWDLRCYHLALQWTGCCVPPWKHMQRNVCPHRCIVFLFSILWGSKPRRLSTPKELQRGLSSCSLRGT